MNAQVQSLTNYIRMSRGGGKHLNSSLVILMGSLEHYWVTASKSDLLSGTPLHSNTLQHLLANV